MCLFEPTSEAFEEVAAAAAVRRWLQTIEGWATAWMTKTNEKMHEDEAAAALQLWAVPFPLRTSPDDAVFAFALALAAVVVLGR